jgi:anaphase-promoting complex subunit 2
MWTIFEQLPWTESTCLARWEPDPVEADPSRTSKSRRLMDIISMLVGIYGSKELFVNEYRVMLAEKLLNKTDYDTDRDIRTLELLKVHLKFIDKEKQTYN